MNLIKTGILITLFASILLAGCEKDDNICIYGTGPIISRTLSVPVFTGINSNGSNNVIITQGATQEVVAVGHANIIDRIETRVTGGVWDIELENGCYKNYELTIYITVPIIEEVLINGSGNIVIHDFVDQGDLYLAINGSGNIDLNAFDGAENLDVNIVGSGNVTGRDGFFNLKNLNINIPGSGNYRGFPIVTDVCNINIPGSGYCEVTVNDILNVAIAGSGNVYFKGFPVLNLTITGSGNVFDSN